MSAAEGAAVPGRGQGGRDLPPAPATLLHHRHRRGCAAREIGADLVLKATKVDGVYTADPKDPATRYSAHELRRGDGRRNLGIMDATAFALCRDQKLPIKVFSIFKPGALKALVLGERRRAPWCTSERPS